MRKKIDEYFTGPIVKLSLDASGRAITCRQLISVIVLFSAAAHIDGALYDREFENYC